MSPACLLKSEAELLLRPMVVAQGAVGQLCPTYWLEDKLGHRPEENLCMQNVPLVTKPTWTALYWGRDRVFAGQPRMEARNFSIVLLTVQIFSDVMAQIFSQELGLLLPDLLFPSCEQHEAYAVGMETRNKSVFFILDVISGSLQGNAAADVGILSKGG